MKFSEKYGFKSARETIQTDSITIELRNSLWSLLTTFIWDQVAYSQFYGTKFLSKESNPAMHSLTRNLWFGYFKKPLDMLSSDWKDVSQELREYFFTCQWYEIYDFIEFIVQNYPYKDLDRFVQVCNSTLQREMSGYRFVGKEIAPITNEQEIHAIDTALGESRGPVRTHLGRALELMSDRAAPDYRNSIKESISAVESLVAATVGEKGTLGQLIKKLEDNIHLHPALGKTFGILYGYTSDAGGIRHALMESPTVTFEDAKFFLVVCSAFVNFVQAKAPQPTPAK